MSRRARIAAQGHRIWARAADGLLAGGLFAASLTVYLQTLAPSVATLFDDSLELPLASHRLAIVHPTGYPLYTLLGKLLTIGAEQAVARRVNLLSAVAAALTVALVYLVIRQLIRRRLPGVLGALALAASPLFWSQAVIAEVYTLHTAFIGAILWLTLRWGRNPLTPVTLGSLRLASRWPTPWRFPGGPLQVVQAGRHAAEASRAKSSHGVRVAPSARDARDPLNPERAQESGHLQQAAQLTESQRTGRSSADAQPTRRTLIGSPLRVAPSGVRRFLSAVWRHGRRVHRGYLRLLPAMKQLATGVHNRYRWLFPVVPAERRLRPHPLIYVLAAISGLSLTHHRTVLLLAPAILAYVLLRERRVLSRAALLGPEHPVRPRILQIAGRPMTLLALCLLGPLVLYLYLPIRGHVGSLDGTYENTWSGFWQWVMARSYGVFLGENPLARELDYAYYAQLLWRQFGPLGLALALVGIIGLLSKPKSLALTGLGVLAFAAFAVLYRVPDVEVFFLPVLLLLAIWIGVGLDHAAHLLRPRGRSLATRRLLAACASLLYLATVAQPWIIASRNYPDLDLSQQWIVHDFGSYLLEQPLPPNSTVVGLLGEMTLLRYFQEVAGPAAHIHTVAADDEVARRRAVDSALTEGRAVYLTRSLPGITADYSLDSVVGVIDVVGHLETLIQVTKPDWQIPDPPRATDLEPVPGLQLLGYGLFEHRGHWQAWARLRLWWRAPNGLTEPLKISARLLDHQGQQVGAADAEPVSGIYPTTAWRPGEAVADAYEIPLVSGLPPGVYRPIVIVYEPASGAERGRVELAPIHLQGNPARPPRRALEASVSRSFYARFGDAALLGFSPPNPEIAYRAGDLLPLTLLWEARVEPVGNLQLSFWLEGEDKHSLGCAPAGGAYPSSQWHNRQVVRHWPALQIPAATPAGLYRLKMRVTRDEQPLPWGRWLIPLGSEVDLGVVRVDY